MERRAEPTLLMRFLFLVLVLLIAAGSGEIFRSAEGGKRPIHITDDLDEVVDDEEDEAWREWGSKKSEPEVFDPPPTDFEKMDFSEIQTQMLQRQQGPVFGFVKLRLGVKRTREMVSEIAMKWSKISRSGSIEAKLMAFDLSTIMVTMVKGQDALELKEFLLNQPEAYEIKIGDQLFRRPGDPPFEELLDKLNHEKDIAANRSLQDDATLQKEEL